MLHLGKSKVNLTTDKISNVSSSVIEPIGVFFFLKPTGYLHIEQERHGYAALLSRCKIRHGPPRLNRRTQAFPEAYAEAQGSRLSWLNKPSSTAFLYRKMVGCAERPTGGIPAVLEFGRAQVIAYHDYSSVIQYHNATVQVSTQFSSAMEPVLAKIPRQTVNLTRWGFEDQKVG